MRLRRALPIVLLAAGACAHVPGDDSASMAIAAASLAGGVVGATTAPPGPATQAGGATAVPAVVAARVLPFDPSPDDRPALGAVGFTGTAKVALPDGTEALGPRVAGVRPGSGLEAAGVKQGDVLWSVAGTTIRPGEADPIGRFREILLRQAPDTEVTLGVWRDGESPREIRALLGRQPPPFARIETPAAWMQSSLANGAVADLIRSALELDGGAARYEDTLERNRKHSRVRDPFRLREVTEAHMNLAANEPLAIEIASACARRPVEAAAIAAGTWRDEAGQGTRIAPLPVTADPAVLAKEIADRVGVVASIVATATQAWTDEDRAHLRESFGKLTERINQGEYLYEDDDPLRERANRRTLAILAKADRAELAAAADAARSLADDATSRLLAATAGKDGLVAALDSPAGRIEIWGRGSQKHTTPCAFLFDLGGDDVYLDVAGRADLGRPVSIFVDASGDDLWTATAPFGLAGAFGGVSFVADLAGDDQYLSREWTQGAAVAGFALLLDGAGRDVYHAQDLSQGIGLQGAGVVSDRGGDDLYTGPRFCQGVGLAGGVGAVLDQSGNDRYVCTGRYDSEYGEAGLFSGWGQGCGFGFRGVTSGGIGVLFDAQGDDVYEAGNFSQGGGYFYAWGVLWDAQGRDRYVGSRYAQGFAAHQAAGTFLEGAGDDLYQSHSGVAQGLSWDETSVVFHDMGGNDRYQTSGFSLASAAHNGMVLFVDDGGDDVYAGLPAKAGSNEYHGGKSFALFLDRGGADVYQGADAKEWNDRAAVRDDGAYHLDLPAVPGPLRSFLR